MSCLTLRVKLENISLTSFMFYIFMKIFVVEWLYENGTR